MLGKSGFLPPCRYIPMGLGREVGRQELVKQCGDSCLPARTASDRVLRGPSLGLGVREQRPADVAEDLRGACGGLW